MVSANAAKIKAMQTDLQNKVKAKQLQVQKLNNDGAEFKHPQSSIGFVVGSNTGHANSIFV